MSMPSIDPSDFTPDQLRGDDIPLRCSCGSTDIRVEQEPFAVCGACGTVGMATEFRKDCVVCGEEFTTKKRIRARRATGKDCCIGCAVDNDETLDADDHNELAEEYWTGREQAAGDGGYYSSERMDAARRIGQ